MNWSYPLEGFRKHNTENKLHKRNRKKYPLTGYLSILNIHPIELTVNSLPLLLWRDLGVFLFCSTKEMNSVVARMANGASLSLSALRMHLYFCGEWSSHCIRWWRISMLQYPHGTVLTKATLTLCSALEWWQNLGGRCVLRISCCLIASMKGCAINLLLRQWVVLAITHYSVKDLAFQSMGNDVWSF